MRQLVIELFVSANGPATKHAMDHAVLYDNDFSKRKKEFTRMDAFSKLNFQRNQSFLANRFEEITQ